MRKGPLALLLALSVALAFLAGAWVAHRAGKGDGSGGKKVLYYVDPMHPSYKSDKPGIAPDCGMALEPVYADGTTGGGSAPAVPGTVTIPLEKRQAFGVAVGKVEKAPWGGTLRLLGRVAPDEARVYRINATTDIWVRKVFPPTTGSLVRKDEPLAGFFTSGYLSAVNALMFARETQRRHEKSADVSQAQAQNMDFQMRQAYGNLINMGVSESQIRDMERTGKAGDLAEVRSPAAGLVLSRAVSEGQYVTAGTELFRVADLSRVWILADTYEGDGNLLRPGMEVRAVHPQTGRSYRARVSPVPPQFDAQTRTMKVRLEASNPDLALRPDMFVDLEVPVRLPPAVTVPEGAVVDAGTRRTVFVEAGDGRFEPRPVETGRRMGGRVEIVRGLSPGEAVVVSGNFLVDSESRMQLAAAGIYGAWHTDPVCGMAVDEGKAQAAGRRADHGGSTYWFCSDDCAGRFRRDPASFLKGGAPGAAAAARHGSGGPSPSAGGGMDAASMGEDLPSDPVCGMRVDPARAKASGRTSEHGGRTYYFCNAACKGTFDRDPGAVLGRAGGSTPPAGKASSVDPVCGMEVDEAQARARGWTAEHGGKTYFFCNPSCKASFEKDPATFLGKGGGGSAVPEGHGHGGR